MTHPFLQNFYDTTPATLPIAKAPVPTGDRAVPNGPADAPNFSATFPIAPMVFPNFPATFPNFSPAAIIYNGLFQSHLRKFQVPNRQIHN